MLFFLLFLGLVRSCVSTNVTDFYCDYAINSIDYPPYLQIFDIDFYIYLFDFDFDLYRINIFDTPIYTTKNFSYWHSGFLPYFFFTPETFVHCLRRRSFEFIITDKGIVCPATAQLF